jgi:hypothetical protein
MFGSQERLHKRLLADGLPAQAVVVRSEPTTWTEGPGGMAVKRKWKVTLRVMPEGDEPFEVDLAMYFKTGQPPNEGSTLSVLFDPADHSKVSADVSSVVSAPAPAGTVDQASVAETRSEIGQMNPASATSLWKLSKMGKQLKELNLAQAREGEGSAFAGQVIVLGATQPVQPVQPAAEPPPPSTVDRLAELSDLHDRGRLTDEEFAQAKKMLLGE